jgi:hypothetical protein
VESTGVIVEVEECVVGEENYELIFIQDWYFIVKSKAAKLSFERKVLEEIWS